MGQGRKGKGLSQQGEAGDWTHYGGVLPTSRVFFNIHDSPFIH
jgi:hypothetical protein